MLNLLREIVKVFNRFLLLGIVVGVITILAMIGFRPPSFCMWPWDCSTGEHTQAEVDCMAAAMLADSAGEETQKTEAQYAIGKALRKYHLVYERDVCITFEQGLMQVPLGYVRKGMFVRDVSFISREFGSEWGDAVKRATEIAKLRKDQLGDGTHIIRAVRTRGWVAKIANIWAVNREAEEQIRASMELIPKPNGARYKLELFKAKK